MKYNIDFYFRSEFITGETFDTPGSKVFKVPIYKRLPPISVEISTSSLLGEHEVGRDRFNKCIYFSRGVSGLIKAVDVWARWEYCRFARFENKRNRPGEKRIKDEYEFRLIGEKDDSYDKEVMERVIFNKLYNDFKNRQYYIIDLIEGKDGDFELGDIDDKKVLCRNEDGAPLPRVIWQYGPYSDFGTPDKPNNTQEDWNMNTKFGDRTISKDRLKILETEAGRTDAISVIIDLYDRYRNTLLKDYLNKLEILDNFIVYAKERYRNDKDYVDGSPDLGRRDINIHEQTKYQIINGIKNNEDIDF